VVSFPYVVGNDPTPQPKALALFRRGFELNARFFSQNPWWQEVRDFVSEAVGVSFSH